MLFDLSLCSKYRPHLMGLAAIMVFICHASVYGVVMPALIEKLVLYGNLGVDIFLFLSGVGCYYSLAKKPDLKTWYKRRFWRIFVPYSIIQIPYCILLICAGQFDFFHFLYSYSTISYWTHHEGAWYVALLVPLYLLTPIVFRLFQQSRHRFVILLLLLVSILVLCHINISTGSELLDRVIDNAQIIFMRCCSFVIGMYCGPMVQSGRKIPFSQIIIPAIGIFIIAHTFLHSVFMYWCLIPALLCICLWLFTKLPSNKKVLRPLAWVGAMSLESYLANIYLCYTMKPIFENIGIRLSSHEVLLEYLLIIVVGLIMAWITHFISSVVYDRSFFH